VESLKNPNNKRIPLAERLTFFTQTEILITFLTYCINNVKKFLESLGFFLEKVRNL